jgi:hypothetical protein
VDFLVAAWYVQSKTIMTGSTPTPGSLIPLTTARRQRFGCLQNRIAVDEIVSLIHYEGIKKRVAVSP